MYIITSYATAEGIETSETATATLVWVKAYAPASGEDAIDMEMERAVVIRSAGDHIEILGTAAEEPVRVYYLGGTMLYDGVPTADQYVVPVAMDKGAIYVVVIGERSIKYRF